MMTSVGLSAPETAASVRATTMRFTEIDWRDHRFEPFTIAEVIEEGLPDLSDRLDEEIGLTSREVRMLRLGTLPLYECLRPLASLKRHPGLILALPETTTTIPFDDGKFMKRLSIQTKEAFNLDKSTASFKGRAGGMRAIGHAYTRIQNGEDDFLIAAGLDTYRDLYILGTMDMEKRVKSTAHLDGFIPGEGAGFVLLASRTEAERAELSPLASITSVIEDFEEGHLYSKKPYLGNGLARAFQEFFQGNGVHDPIQEVYSSMNGENHWAKEWGVAFMRNQEHFNPQYRIHHPADCFGDTGAACGPILAGLASIGMKQGYRKCPALIYGSSDHGERAVLSIGSP